MSVLQSFCCAIGPAFTGLFVGYITILLIKKATKDSNSHSDF